MPQIITFVSAEDNEKLKEKAKNQNISKSDALSQLIHEVLNKDDTNN